MLTPAPDGSIADAIAAAAQGLDPSEPLTFVRHHGDDDVYNRGPELGGVLFFIPGLWTGMPSELLASVRARRTCSVTGRCPSCDACVQLTTGRFAHEPQCHVADDELHPALIAWYRQVGKYARGRRIRETPGAEN